MLLRSSTDNVTRVAPRYSVLVLCTGNSARSIMGEALFNQLGAPYFRAFSAGSRPVGKVNPFALEQIQCLAPIDHQYQSKNWFEFASTDAPHIDFVITVCSNAAEETCPAFHGESIRIHWPLPDPAAVQTSSAEARAAFADVFTELKRRIVSLLSLPLEKMDRTQIAAAMQSLA